MKLFQLVAIILGLLSLVVSACGSTDVIAALVTASPAESSQIEPATDTPMPSPDPGKASIPTSAEGVSGAPIESAKKDLASHLGISVDQVQVAAAQEVIWPDASLGCPLPGMAYAQVVTPGYWILLEAAGNQYPYHTDMESQVTLCQEELIPIFRVTPGEIDDGKPWMPVD